MSRGDYPVTYRVLALKDGLVVKLQFAHGERDELVFTNGEAEQFATALLGTRATAKYTLCGQAAWDCQNSDVVVLSPLPARPPEGLAWCPACIGKQAELLGLLEEIAASVAAYDPELSA